MANMRRINPVIPSIPLRRFIGIVAGSLVLFIGAAILAHHSTLSGWEAGLFGLIYHLPIILNPLFLAITYLGTAWTLLAVTLACIVKKREWLALQLLIAGLVAYALAGSAKHFVGRPRPINLLQHITQRDILVTGAGFPSGHTALATTMALMVLPYLPRRWRWLAMLWIASVAISRIYLGAHFPLDIVGGFAIGCFTAATVVFSLRPPTKYIKDVKVPSVSE